ncbi:threonine synthase [Clostridium sp. SYSU_GA19001]|uniref:threonine synthase n=1 Tax=Clostridium caldaquaticum TaxID=2940653 RepID=UPI00207734C9|nr:threonine synthase [Clostridium caldaquaticum]MCM8710904.1 threonine synthase [Clostridium caldaquaticum]
MLYRSTRVQENMVRASEAIIRGIASDGGLYVPEQFPKIDKSFDELSKMSYQEIAFYVLKKYFDDFSDEELKDCIYKAYDDKFETPEIAPLSYNAGVYFLELYHGKTLAFKDMALSILPHLLKTAAKKLNINKEIVILTATSGDTGKAALEGFADVEGTKIIVFYPKDGVSEIQKKQMTTQEGNNTFVVGIEGNFDDAQTGVKEIFNDSEFNKLLNEKGYLFSSANSINIGRLVPQIVYYVYTYAVLWGEKKIKNGESINIAVPTGNFGNILAAFYAKLMGVPIGKLICASNENKVLADFINTGIYDRRRDFFVTNSPSMDILISSNLERFLYEISGRDNKLITMLMEQLSKEGWYEINEEMKKKLECLYADFATEDETLSAVKKVQEDSHYLIDTHTAVAYEVYEKYKKSTGDETVTVIASTASPFKFAGSMNKALNFSDNTVSDFDIIDDMSKKYDIQIPKSIQSLKNKEIRHKVTCKKDEMKELIKKFLMM